MTQPSEEGMIRDLEAHMESDKDILFRDVPEVCSVCDKASTTGSLKRCAACRFFYYCSVDCQRQHWQEHKPQCKKFTDLRNLYTLVPAWYLHYCLRWTRIDEFIWRAKKHRTDLVEKIKAKSSVVHLQASWIPSPIVIDGNSKHLVVYLSYLISPEGEEEEFSEQTFYRVFLCGTQSYNDRVTCGNSFVDNVTSELQAHGITVAKVVRGVGLN
eukprot:TRINITY_DN7613_c0_g1_i1.p1 TRINITY_DN7613_c0_g1~~TRINITY_DN7613_c0_g1_i1.p1  ORF type:complete len:213 (+),score=32.97 TRINITY_DN7613_c0_g1_i1:1-639(+)